MNLFIILNPVGIFRTIIFIAIVYFVIRLFTRYLLPLIVENKVKEMQKKMQEQQRQQKHSGKREGEITIEYDPGSKNVRNRDEGDYVDFEEVE